MNNSSIEVCVRPDVNCVFVKHHGDITLKSVLERFDIIRNHPLYSPPMDFLVDHFDCNTRLSEDDLRVIAGYLNGRTDQLKGYRHIVLTSDPLSFGLFRIWTALTDTDGVEKEIFISRTEDERSELKRKALVWLGLNPSLQVDIWSD